jgi:acyl-CoA thioesterase FadM
MELELGRVTDRKPPFKFSSLTRVGFSDTDAQGIVYYGRYFPYFDVARVEYFVTFICCTRTRGRPRTACLDISTSLRRASTITRGVHRVERIGRTSMTSRQAYRVDDDLFPTGPSDSRPRRPGGAEGVPDSRPDPGRDSR